MTSGDAPRAGGAAVPGARHLRADAPCQDAVTHLERSFEHGPVVALAVADGHGSSVHGQVGARLAVEVATEGLLGFYASLPPAHRERLSAVRELARAPGGRLLVQAWVDRVAEHAGGEPTPALLRDYGTTLLFALAAPDLLLVGQIGDGDVLLVGADGRTSRPLPPEPLAFAEETPSLCQKEAWLRLRLAALPRPRSEALVLLSTDGYANSYEDDATFERIGPDYLRLVQVCGFSDVLNLLPDFLTQVSARGSGDDVTLGLLHLPGPGAEAPDTPPRSEEPCPAS